MSTNHLLSTSLFTELFQHNIVSADGRIIANEKQLEDYYSFLVQQSKDRIVSLYEERKNLVITVQKLLRTGCDLTEERRLLTNLLNELDLKLEEEGELSLMAPKKLKKKYLGPTEPRKSSFEREVEQELKRVKVLKRDLRILDEWLEEISRVRSIDCEHQFDSGESGKKFRKRTNNRMRDMHNARSKLIKHHYADYDRNLKKVLDPTFVTKIQGKQRVCDAPGTADEKASSSKDLDDAGEYDSNAEHEKEGDGKPSSQEEEK